MHGIVSFEIITSGYKKFSTFYPKKKADCTRNLVYCVKYFL